MMIKIVNKKSMTKIRWLRYTRLRIVVIKKMGLSIRTYQLD